MLAAALLFGAVTLHAQDAIYGIKSARLKYETQTSGGLQYNEVWFDDEKKDEAKMTESGEGINRANLTEEDMKKSQIKEFGANNTMIVKQFDENPKIPASTFTLPKVIK